MQTQTPYKQLVNVLTCRLLKGFATQSADASLRSYDLIALEPLESCALGVS